MHYHAQIENNNFISIFASTTKKNILRFMKYGLLGRTESKEAIGPNLYFIL